MFTIIGKVAAILIDPLYMAIEVGSCMFWDIIIYVQNLV